jgi:monoamine oxidase
MLTFAIIKMCNLDNTYLLMKTEILIIGAGASGLMAAYKLVKAGQKVTVLEARNRLGGRIHTIQAYNSSERAELGAEFVHGDLPVTKQLLDEAGIRYYKSGFEMWQYDEGKFTQNEEFVEGWGDFLEKLDELEEDMTMHDFLQEYFAGEGNAELRQKVENYVAGYDTANPRDASAFALRAEWNHEDDDAQHLIDGGYGPMIDYLATEIKNAGNEIILNAEVSKIEWQRDIAKIVTADGSNYQAAKVIIALPLGVLQSGNIKFNPQLPEYTDAFNGIGYGWLIKVLLDFNQIFWENDGVMHHSGKEPVTRFFFTGQAVPTFWTQAGSKQLTGWLGGIPADERKDFPDEEILMLTLDSLSKVFNISTAELKDKLTAWHVANWTSDPHTLGSYSYNKLESDAARKILLAPVDETIYFAGEYLYDGTAIGTVEAALTSGKDVAKMILGSLSQK